MAGVQDSDANLNARPSRRDVSRAPDPPPTPPDDSSASSAEGVAEIVREIREGLAEISARELELRRHEQYFGRRYHDLEQAAIRTFAEEHDQAQQRLVQQAAELNAQAVEIAAQRARLKAVTDEMHARQLELEQQRGDLARRTQQSRQRTESLRLWLQQQHQLLSERREATGRQEQELEARARRVAEAAARERAELDRHRVELEARAAELGESEQKLLEHHAALARQASTTAIAPLADESATFDLVLKPITQPLARPVLTLRRVWWPRVTAVALLVSLLAATAWVLTHPATYRATTRVRIASETPLPREVVNRHRVSLLDPALLADDPLAASWRTACEETCVTAKVTDDGALTLSVLAPAASAARQLSAAACAAFAQRVRAGVGNTELPLGYQDLVLRRERLEAHLTQLRQAAADEPTSAEASSAAEREPATAAAEQIEGDLADVSAALEGQRASLAVLVAVDVPHGSVDPAAVDEALAADTIYREDHAEFHAVALQYRTELAVAMLMLVDPIKAVNKALTATAGSLAEQRGLDPPAEIAKVLEACATDVSQAQTEFTPLTGQWQSWLDTVQNLDVSADVVALVTQQNQAGDTVRRLADEGAALVEQIGSRIDALGDGGGGTREVVVAAVLRNDHAALKTAMQAFVGASGRIATAENFELDAQDHKLRGLRMRLNSRRDTITQQLQLDADRTQREQHAAQLQEAREQVRDLERRREELVANLAATLRKLRALDEATQRYETWKLRAGQRDAEIAWLAARSAEMARELAEAQEVGTVPEQVEFAAPAIEHLAPGRTRNALLAGGCAFALAWLLGAVLRLRSPARQPHWS